MIFIVAQARKVRCLLSRAPWLPFSMPGTSGAAQWLLTEQKPNAIMKLTNAFFLTCIYLCGTSLTSDVSALQPVSGLSVKDSFPARLSGPGSPALFAFADSLYNAGDYFFASIEYERIYYLAPEREVRTTANLKKVQALKQLGSFGKAGRDIRRSLPFVTDGESGFNILYEMAFCAYMEKDYASSLLALDQISHSASGQTNLAKTRLLRGLVYTQMEDWAGLASHLDAWCPDESQAVRLMDSLRFVLVEAERFRQKSVRKARMLSTFLPGTGHLYAGRPGKGALNAFSQAASLGSAVLLAANGYYISTFAVGLSLFQSFYFGGIRQAGSLAESSNEHELAALKQKVAGMLLLLESERQLHERFQQDTSEAPGGIAPERQAGQASHLALNEALATLMKALYDFDLEKADSISKSLIQSWPEHYLSWFARTNYLWWEIISSPQATELETQYRDHIAQSMSLAKTRFSRNPDHSDIFYFISLYAMQARLDLKNGAYIRAMRNGRNAISYIEQSRGKESQYGGFYLTSGLYNYMTTQATRKYPFLKIYSLFYPEGNRELGLQQLIRISESDNRVWGTEASYFLMRLYLEVEDDPEKALLYAARLTGRFPSNLIFQYYHYQALKALNDVEAVDSKREEIRARALSNRSISDAHRQYFYRLVSE